MSRHVHLPPIMPYEGPKPLEKKEKLRRKPGILTEKSEETADTKPEQVNAPPPPPPPVHNSNPLSGSGSQLSVLLGAQEEAQPVTTAPARKPDDFI